MAGGKSHKYVWNKGQFDTVDPQATDYLLGVFSTSHMSYELDRDNSSTGQPSIAEMTRKAIQILKKDDDGFFLFVEGARIDHAHHETKAKKALHDTLAFDDAVKAAVEETSDEDTLIIVTADHSHVFNIAGYPAIGNDILGLVDPMDPEDVPIDKMPYTTLVYGNGPNYTRNNLTGVDTKDKEYQQPAAVPAVEETHSAQDVAIFARGPMSHLFHGVHEQTYIAHVMAYASCVGMNKEHCSKTYYPPCTQASDALTINLFLFYLSITFIYLIR
ncbi:alkaline phosphatase, tissue-nonspecific isozyme [Patella vulgata]|uniref:alkaline phosphatase, tissue-nonspecific isozyme n=1 Tax=Patella vulgata TaxID=6465 RepID=UPI0021801785|nr:alkaline phosphatase, tissue-nonspecific isozyme [Patella vulgata]